MENKTILIFGGTGSLGNALIKKYINNNKIVCYSRDENKHWKMNMEYKNGNVSFIIGDIRNYERVELAICRTNPNIIINCSAIKHIDMAEINLNECLQTNLIGNMNVCDVIEKNMDRLKSLECVCFISTDKACSPVNTYGLSKALAEKYIIEKAYYNKNIKFVSVRYGNVLNSRGSIIPILQEKMKDENVKELTLTHEDMTRFIMTLEQSVDLIEHAILKADSGDIVIPILKAMHIKDLFEIFSEKCDKKIKIIGLRPGEKLHESLINHSQSFNSLKSECGKYYYLKPFYKNFFDMNNEIEYSSNNDVISKEELKSYLESLNLC